jgi:glycosyltransferase involved in cell wall biosynthesis
MTDHSARPQPSSTSQGAPPDAPLPLSLAIVCHNNASTIARTLDSVAPLASEIVAVDGGSTDATLELLAHHHARVITSPWLGYVRTKQLAIDHCTQPWVLLLDSDESIEPPLARSIRAALSSWQEGGPAGYQLNRKVFYSGRFLHHAWQPEWRTRLARRELCQQRGIDPHDHLHVTGRVERLAGDLRHDSFASFEDQFRKQVGYARAMADQLVAQGHRGSRVRLVTSPLGAFAKQLILKGAWRDGWAGWLAAASTSANALVKHAVLIERAHRSRVD